ncbi:MAG: hypothetical protein GX228_06280 [Firmicutes bacterium]|jgi:hypothetical protein|nr:hypothetical protein [Bacillota bacterium]
MKAIVDRGYGKAHRMLSDMDFRIHLLDTLNKEQEALEKDYWQGRTLSFGDLTNLSGKGLGLVFTFTARVSGMIENTACLQRLGRAIGQIVYTIDCLEDLETDLAKGRFNGLQAAGMVEDGRLTAESLSALNYF